MSRSGLEKKREPLTRERIELAALDLIERDGLAAFSTRKLATDLHCEAMSIYHYFPSKGHLMDALIDHVIAEIPPLADQSLPWIERLRQMGHDWRQTMIRRPNLFIFVGTHRMNTPAALAWLNRTLEFCHQSGLGHEASVRLFRIVGYYLMGACLDETAGYARGPTTVEPLSDEIMAMRFPEIVGAAPLFRPSEFATTFETGWELMLAGIEAEISRARL